MRRRLAQHGRRGEPRCRLVGVRTIAVLCLVTRLYGDELMRTHRGCSRLLLASSLFLASGSFCCTLRHLEIRPYNFNLDCYNGIILSLYYFESPPFSTLSRTSTTTFVLNRVASILTLRLLFRGQAQPIINGTCTCDCGFIVLAVAEPTICVSSLLSLSGLRACTQLHVRNSRTAQKIALWNNDACTRVT